MSAYGGVGLSIVSPIEIMLTVGIPWRKYCILFSISYREQVGHSRVDGTKFNFDADCRYVDGIEVCLMLWITL